MCVPTHHNISTSSGREIGSPYLTGGLVCLVDRRTAAGPVAQALELLERVELLQVAQALELLEQGESLQVDQALELLDPLGLGL